MIYIYRAKSNANNNLNTGTSSSGPKISVGKYIGNYQKLLNDLFNEKEAAQVNNRKDISNWQLSE